VNPISTLRAIAKEWQYSVRIGKDFRSRVRLMTDYLLSHALFAMPRNMMNRERVITTRAGVKLSYRLNRGDLQGIREVWGNEVYTLPFATPSGALLDLGANIGLTTTWMATHNHFTRIVAVEPDHDNAVLLAKNLEQNGIKGEVIEAAVGPRDGTVHFKKSSWFNLGTCVETSSDSHGPRGEEVPVRMVSVPYILNHFGLDSLGVVKVDIEGSEQALFLGPCGWLERASALIVEFHLALVDYPLLTKTVASHGFKHIPPSSQHTDCFVRFPTNRFN
jgi:FkbM family methyltransferase